MAILKRSADCGYVVKNLTKEMRKMGDIGSRCATVPLTCLSGSSAGSSGSKDHVRGARVTPRRVGVLSDVPRCFQTTRQVCYGGQVADEWIWHDIALQNEAPPWLVILG